LSLSLAVRHIPDPVHLSGRDILHATLLHALVIIVLIVLVLWRPNTLPLPPKAIEVSLISADMLKKIKPKPKPPLAKPRPKKKPKPRLKPRLKPKVKKARALPKNYDPFAPLISKAKAPSRPGAATPGIVADLRRQLSQKEMDRYIGMIQAAVLEHWKVPADLSNFREDPLVTMELNPNGSVRRLEIAVSSGSKALDDSLIRAIQAAAPFTLPRRQFEVFRTNRIRFHPLR